MRNLTIAFVEQPQTLKRKVKVYVLNRLRVSRNQGGKSAGCESATFAAHFGPESPNQTVNQ